jgi:hypothetical protein
LKTDLTNVFVQKPTSWKTKKYTIDNLHVRQIFDLGKKSKFRKELIKISKIAKFGCEML